MGKLILCKDCGEMKEHYARGYCVTCYRRRQTRGEFASKTCSVDGCKRGAVKKGMCEKHWQRARQTKKVTYNGKQIPEYQAIYCQHHGLDCIPNGYEIHHIDGDATNNSIDNLQLVTREEHAKIHADDRAEQACGHRDWRCCTFCKQYDSRENLVQDRTNFYHKECYREYQRKYRRNRYTNDPEFRERKKRQWREWYYRQKNQNQMSLTSNTD